MKKELLKYEFWETADKYYSKLFDRVISSDLKDIRKNLSKAIFHKNLPKSIKWIDIGSGDGATLSAIFDVAPNLKKIRIELIVVEPSSKATRILKSKLKKYNNISLKVINKGFNLSLFKNKKLDSNIDKRLWDYCRFGHFINAKNNEINKINKAIKKGQLNLALNDMYANSENLKSLAST